MTGLGGRHLTRGLQLVETQALLYNEYHDAIHNDWGLIACIDTSISGPSKSRIDVTRKKSIWKNSEMSNDCYFLSETLLISSWIPQQNVRTREF